MSDDASRRAVVGRAVEEAAVADFLAVGSVPGGLVVEGEAGIGKSTLWGTAVSLASSRSMRVLSVRPAEAEARMSFAGLGDLLDPVADELLPRLDPPARAVLEVALLRRLSGQGAASEREIGAALFAGLRSLASDRQVLVAVDDVQWLDRASAEVLAFALRRLRDEQLWVLLARRVGERHPGTAAAADASLIVLGALTGRPVRTVTLGPLSDADVADLLRPRLDGGVSAATRRTMVNAARGNPYWALELGRAFESTAQTQDRRLTIPTTLASLLDLRLEGESPVVKAVLLAVAAMSRPTCGSVGRALAGDVVDPDSAIDAAVAAGVVIETAGRLRPAHPLLGSQALQSLPPGERRRLHRRLAETAVDPEQKARHLALASDGEPDQEVSAVLEAGAVSARSRGAVQTAGELAELAIGLTPPTARGDLSRRRLAAAELFFAAGDLHRACEMAEEVASGDPSSAEWPVLLPILVESTYWVRGQDAAQAVVRTVLDGFGGDLRCRAVALACAADVGDGLGTARSELAQESIRLFDVVGDTDPGALSMALVYLAEDRLDAGEGIAADLLERAEAAEIRQQSSHPRAVPVLNRVRSIRAYQLKLVDDLDGARTELTRALQTARSEGDDGSLPALLGHLALTEYWAGNFRRSSDSAAEGLALVAASGGVAPATLYAAAGLSAIVTGDPERGRTIIADQLTGGGPPSKKTVAYQHVLGLADLLDGRAEQAMEHFEQAWTAAITLHICEPGRRQRLEGDLGQALVATRQLERAGSIAAEQQRLGKHLGRPTLVGVGLRLDGLVLAARGELDGALTCLEEAVAAHRRSPLALELPRSQLALGQVQRRLRSKPLARNNFRAAAEGFDALGAIPWARLAHAELARLDGPRPGAGLTATEERVAHLAGAGLGNKEIAGEMFLSVRTVEGHLAIIYRKLGIRGRAELARRTL